MSELSKIDLQDYLAEINEQNENFSLDNLEPEDIANIQAREKEELSKCELSQEDLLIYRGLAKSKRPIDQRYEERKAIEREAAKEALVQTNLDLNTVISATDKQQLIAFLVSDYVAQKNKYKAYVDWFFNKSFKMYVPNNVLALWNKYRHMFVPFPGFMYQCTINYGAKKNYWVELDLPMYFKPEICDTLIKVRQADRLPRVENSIKRYYEHRQLQVEAEVKHARTLVKISTYMQLLQQKPYWYYLLYNYLKTKNGWT